MFKTKTNLLLQLLSQLLSESGKKRSITKYNQNIEKILEFVRKKTEYDGKILQKYYEYMKKYKKIMEENYEQNVYMRKMNE